MPNTSVSPLVSVLMPAYNHASFVGAAVESVLGQTYGNLELIAIDDGSSDATWQVLESFDDPRLQRFRHEVNRGAHATLNEALKLAEGEFIAIINSDDVYDAGRIAALVATAERADARDVLVFSDVAFIDAQGAGAEAHPRALDYAALARRCADLEADIRLLAGNLAISTSNFFFSRSLGERVGPFAPLRYTHDWDWALRAGLQGVPIWVREPLLSYRIHGANTLSEDDAWRHIHENSYVQAKALIALREQPANEKDSLAGAQSVCQALLQNESFHPVALSLYLTCFLAGVRNEDMLALSCIRNGDWMLKRLADAAARPPSLFGPIARLAEREKMIASQQTLIEEKDRGIAAQAALIEEKDRGIAAQTALIEEKNRGIAAQTALIAEKDRGIVAQTALIEQKDQGVAAQAVLIDERNRYIEELRAENATQSNQLKRLEGELADLHGSRVVRLAVSVRRRLQQLARLVGRDR